MRPLGKSLTSTNAIRWCLAAVHAENPIPAGTSRIGAAQHRAWHTLSGLGGGQQLGDQGLDAVCDVVADHAHNVEGLAGGIG